MQVSIHCSLKQHLKYLNSFVCKYNKNPTSGVLILTWSVSASSLRSIYSLMYNYDKFHTHCMEYSILHTMCVLKSHTIVGLMFFKAMQGDNARYPMDSHVWSQCSSFRVFHAQAHVARSRLYARNQSALCVAMLANEYARWR